MNLDSQQYVDLIFGGIKFVEGIPFLERRILNNKDIHTRCKFISVTKILNVDLQLPYSSEGVDTLSEVVGSFIEWDTPKILKNIRSPQNKFEVNDNMDAHESHGHDIVPCRDRSSFLIRKVKLLHRCLDRHNYVSIGLITNVNEKDPFQVLRIQNELHAFLERYLLRSLLRYLVFEMNPVDMFQNSLFEIPILKFQLRTSCFELPILNSFYFPFCKTFRENSS